MYPGQKTLKLFPAVETEGVVDRFSIMDTYMETKIYPGFYRYFEERT